MDKCKFKNTGSIILHFTHKTSLISHSATVKQCDPQGQHHLLSIVNMVNLLCYHFTFEKKQLKLLYNTIWCSIYHYDNSNFNSKFKHPLLLRDQNWPFPLRGQLIHLSSVPVFMIITMTGQK